MRPPPGKPPHLLRAGRSRVFPSVDLFHACKRVCNAPSATLVHEKGEQSRPCSSDCPSLLCSSHSQLAVSLNVILSPHVSMSSLQSRTPKSKNVTHAGGGKKNTISRLDGDVTEVVMPRQIHCQTNAPIRSFKWFRAGEELEVEPASQHPPCLRKRRSSESV